MRLYAAGSLLAAMTEIGNAFEGAGNVRIEIEFGASGLLRDRRAAERPFFAASTQTFLRWAD